MNKALIILAIAGLLAFGTALSYHFILLDNNKVKILKKDEITLDKTFIDARGARRLRLFLDPTLIKAGVKDLLEGVEKVAPLRP